MGKRERSRKLNPDLGLLDAVGRGNCEGKTKEKNETIKRSQRGGKKSIPVQRIAQPRVLYYVQISSGK